MQLSKKKKKRTYIGVNKINLIKINRINKIRRKEKLLYGQTDEEIESKRFLKKKREGDSEKLYICVVNGEV